MNAATQQLTWCSRDAVAKIVGRPRSASGLLLVSVAPDVVTPLAPKEKDETLAITRETLASFGLGDGDRVAIALNNDGDGTGGLLTEAAVDLAEAVANLGPRGRMRLRTAIESLRANVLITTASGAADFLARLHMEFLADPLDLELRALVLVGEIADHETYRHLGREFDAEIIEVLNDPLTGAALAYRRPLSADGTWHVTREDTVRLAPLESDEILDFPPPAGRAEVVIHHPWHSKLSGAMVRSGYICEVPEGSTGIPAISHTSGGHVLIRGRWVSLARIESALKLIDGITRVRLEIERQGTIDTATVHVTFGRATLVKNPMWRGRIAEAIYSVSPVEIGIEIDEVVQEVAVPFEVLDRRGHHLTDTRV